jgi:hypothetical protein
MRSNGPLANKKVAMGGPVAWRPVGQAIPPDWPKVAVWSAGAITSIRPRLPKKLEPCGWMPFSGLGPFRWGIADSDSVNHGSNPGSPAMNPSDIASYFWFWQSLE